MLPLLLQISASSLRNPLSSAGDSLVVLPEADEVMLSKGHVTAHMSVVGTAGHDDACDTIHSIMKNSRN